MEWRPIETAPLCDRMNQILLAWRYRPVGTGWWDIDDDYDTRDGKWWVSPREGWRADGDSCIPIEGGWPTHWMPLPPKP